MKQDKGTKLYKCHCVLQHHFQLLFFFKPISLKNILDDVVKIISFTILDLENTYFFLILCDEVDTLMLYFEVWWHWFDCLSYELNEPRFQGTSFILERTTGKQNYGYLDLVIW